MNSLHSEDDVRSSQGHGSSSPEFEGRTVVTTRQARQGVTGHNVRYMLIFGLAAIVAVFAAIWLAYFA
jgi:cobalamin biosynthesis Mg chelatase CobN